MIVTLYGRHNTHAVMVTAFLFNNISCYNIRGIVLEAYLQIFIIAEVQEDGEQDKRHGHANHWEYQKRTSSEHLHQWYLQLRIPQHFTTKKLITVQL